jgi:phosphoglycolate phosphatase-like HAD superfamily hydrolase
LETLALLHHAGKLIGVASGNLETIGWHKIEAAGLREHFSFGFFSDHCETRQGIFQNALRHVARQFGPEAKTCFIGDTPSDIKAAREVGASIIAVASGIFGFDELNACTPDLCISQCGELTAGKYSLRIPPLRG